MLRLGHALPQEKGHRAFPNRLLAELVGAKVQREYGLVRSRDLEILDYAHRRADIPVLAARCSPAAQEAPLGLLRAHGGMPWAEASPLCALDLETHGFLKEKGHAWLSWRT